MIIFFSASMEMQDKECGCWVFKILMTKIRPKQICDC